jgi:DNA-binding LacI/PurR family transcriptional regulator
MGYRPNAKVAELMAEVRASRGTNLEGCFGVVSLYDNPRPWERSAHLFAIYRSMKLRANELGYRLEPIWLSAPGMTRRRVCSILDARGIQGLISFGSPELHENFPAELDRYAVVTVGLSIQTRLHRVTSHFYNDTTATLNRVRQMGYRNPGLVIGNYEDERSGGAHSGAYLAWCERNLGGARPVPILRMDGLDGGAFAAWHARHRPDVVIFIHTYDVVKEFAAFLRREKFGVPGKLGVAAVTHLLDGTGFSGMQQNQYLMGAWAVELLVARVMHRDFGIPANPRTELVESRWFDGTSVRRVGAAP